MKRNRIDKINDLEYFHFSEEFTNSRARIIIFNISMNRIVEKQ